MVDWIWLPLKKPLKTENTIPDKQPGQLKTNKLLKSEVVRVSFCVLWKGS